MKESARTLNDDTYEPPDTRGMCEGSGEPAIEIEVFLNRSNTPRLMRNRGKRYGKCSVCRRGLYVTAQGNVLQHKPARTEEERTTKPSYW